MTGSNKTGKPHPTTHLQLECSESKQSQSMWCRLFFTAVHGCAPRVNFQSHWHIPTCDEHGKVIHAYRAHVFVVVWFRKIWMVRFFCSPGEEKIFTWAFKYLQMKPQYGREQLLGTCDSLGGTGKVSDLLVGIQHKESCFVSYSHSQLCLCVNTCSHSSALR